MSTMLHDHRANGILYEGSSLCRFRRLLLPDLRQQLWIPALRHIRVALDAVEQRRFAEMVPFAFHKRELNVISATLAI